MWNNYSWVVLNEKTTLKILFVNATMSCRNIAIPYAQLWGRILPTQFSGFLTTIWGNSPFRWLSLTLLYLTNVLLPFCFTTFLPPLQKCFLWNYQSYFTYWKWVAKVSNIKNQCCFFHLVNVSHLGKCFNLSKSETNAQISSRGNPWKVVLGRQVFASLK